MKITAILAVFSIAITAGLTFKMVEGAEAIGNNGDSKKIAYNVDVASRA